MQESRIPPKGLITPLQCIFAVTLNSVKRERPLVFAACHNYRVTAAGYEPLFSGIASRRCAVVAFATTCILVTYTYVELLIYCNLRSLVTCNLYFLVTFNDLSGNDL